MTESSRLRLWWTAGVPLALAAAVLSWSIWSRPASEQQAGDEVRTAAARNGFTLANLLVPLDSLADAGMGRNGTHPLDHPAFIAADQVQQINSSERGKLLVATDRVVGLVIAGDARAYPLRLLRWHEVVNDTVGGAPVAVTYSPLCDSVVVVDRTVNGEELLFGVSGLLLNSNLLLYDRRPEPASSSLWSQLEARAIAGAAARHGHRLRILDAELCTWASWAERHPDSQVLAPTPELARLYKRDPYHSYFGSDLLRFPVHPLPPPTAGLRLKDRVVVVEHAGQRKVFSLDRLRATTGDAAGRWHDVIGTTPMTISYAQPLGVATVTVGDDSAAPPALRYAFWFAWHAAAPDAPLPGP